MGSSSRAPRPNDGRRYRVTLLPGAVKDVERLARQPIYPLVRAAIDGLAGEPRPAGCKKLQARPGWRVRVGDYRILYDIDDGLTIVAVLRVRHRREVYD